MARVIQIVALVDTFVIRKNVAVLLPITAIICALVMIVPSDVPSVTANVVLVVFMHPTCGMF